MNILHHKSYHVYNKKNIEKVKKDEAEAEKQAKAKQDRVILAESEARIALLRKRANAKLPFSSVNDNPIHHVNLFQDNNKNEEHEAEVKEKDEKWSKQITMYLDKGVKKEDNPWYTKKKDKQDKYLDKYSFKRKQDKDSSKRRKRNPIKLLEDPLDLVNSLLKERETKDKKKKVSTSSSSASPSLQELRAKRLERENNEKVRVKQLYLGPDAKQEEELDDRKRGYNSQFNRKETNQAKLYNKKRRYNGSQ